MTFSPSVCEETLSALIRPTQVLGESTSMGEVFKRACATQHFLSRIFPLKEITRRTTQNKRTLLALKVIALLVALFTAHRTYNWHDVNTRQLIVVVVPSRSQDNWISAEDASVVARLIPSLKNSLTPRELQKYSVELLVAFDAGDPFWEEPSVISKVEERSTTLKLPIHFLSVQKMPRIPFNEACRAAYDLGAEYIIRVNDDTEFRGRAWLTAAIRVLESFNPPRIGVVGPTCNQGNKRILTHDMVHRTHLDIFGDYYPPEFYNWWLDDWISQVYGVERTRKLRTWVVVHATSRYGTRYEPNISQKELLPLVLVRSKQQLIAYLEARAHGTAG